MIKKLTSLKIRTPMNKKLLCSSLHSSVVFCCAFLNNAKVSLNGAGNPLSQKSGVSKLNCSFIYAMHFMNCGFCTSLNFDILLLANF